MKKHGKPSFKFAKKEKFMKAKEKVKAFLYHHFIVLSSTITS